MSSDNKSMTFSCDVRIPTSELNHDDIRNLITGFTEFPDRQVAIRYAESVTSRDEAEPCGRLYADLTEVYEDDHHLQITLHGILEGNNAAQIKRHLNSQRIFTSLPLIYRPDSETGEMSVIAFSDPILRYLAPPPVQGINLRRRKPYMCQQTYEEYMQQLAIKESLKYEDPANY